MLTFTVSGSPLPEHLGELFIHSFKMDAAMRLVVANKIRMGINVLHSSRKI